MGCKASVVRSDGSVTSLTPNDPHRAAPPSNLPLKPKPTRISSQTTAGPTSEATQEGAAAAGRRKSSRTSLPTSPRHGSDDTAANPPAQPPVTYAQDDDPFALPPPLLPEAAEKSDSVLTVHHGSRSSSSSSSSGSSFDGGEDGRHPRRGRLHSSSGREAGQVENHFDPIPMPDSAHRDDHGGEQKDPHHPRLPSAESRTISKGSTGTFRTAISDHEKTDSAQAAKEYQQRMEAKRRAEEVHTKRRRLEEFDPVRPLDSFNVTHRGLLGRCWDRRAPELIPVSFVHAIAKALGVDESHPASTTTASHLSGGEEFPPGSPIQHPSRLSRQSGPRGSGGPPAPTWTGIGGRRVPRRSHWFSVGGISTDGLNPARTTSPTGVEPFYLSSVASSPTVPRAPPQLVFPSNSPPMLLAGGPMMRGGPLPMLLNSNSSNNAKPSPKKAAPAPAAAVAAKAESVTSLEDGSFTVRILTPEQVMALPWETRERYFSVMLSRNPRFMGIKDHFAFKLSSGVSTDRSVKFLRKRNLEPAPGVTAVRWNRVEFFHPSLHTLVRAVSKTQGASMELRRIEAASSHTADGSGGANHTSSGAAAAVPAVAVSAPNDANNSGSGLNDGSGSPRHRSSATSTTAAAAPSAGAVALPEAERDGAVTTVVPDILHRSFSQCVMGQVENRSFARNNGGGGGGNGGGSANGSFLNSTLNINPIGGAVPGDGAASAGRADKPANSSLTRGAGSFLMGLHRSHTKEMKSNEVSGTAASSALTFPEDSVLSLALGMPCSRLGQLAGVPPAVRNAALSSTGRITGSFLFPPTSAVGLGSRKASRDTMNSTTSGGNGSSSGGGGAAFPALRPSPDTVLVSLNVSCFSVSINPFEWQERHYTRHPVDIDGSKRSARSAYGEGVVTDVMYGGLMVVECSSLQAERELQALLASMAWTEERSLQGIVKDVRKHLKTVQSNLHKARAASAAKTAGSSGGATTAAAAAEDATRDWSAHRYRIIRRIGGRPMRDAVELQDIRVFFDDDETMREERTTLHHPEQRRRVPVATAQSPLVPPTAKKRDGGGGNAKGSWPPSPGIDKTLTEERAGASHSSPNAPDPDVSSSFSRVASAWFGLPVISAVLRTWALHLLACPEYAQPISIFLQKHAGLAPALQLTALGSFYHDGNTPSDDSDVVHDADSLFFETDGPLYDDNQRSGNGGHESHHPQPTPRIPKYNRFYASLPPSPASQQTDEHERDHDGVDGAGGGGVNGKGGRSSSGGGQREEGSGTAAQRRTAGGASRPPRKDAPTAASSPANYKSSGVALDQLAAHADAQSSSSHHHHHHHHQHHKTRDAVPEEKDSFNGLGPKSHSKETVEGEGAMQLLDSQNSTLPPPPASATSVAGGGGRAVGSRQSTGLLSASDKTTSAVIEQPQQRQLSGAKGAKKPTPKAEVAAAGPAQTTASVGKAKPPAQVSKGSASAGTRPTSRCQSPLSPGRRTVPHSRRNRAASSSASSTASADSSSSSSSSFFGSTSSSGNTRNSTFVYHRNTTSSTGGATSLEPSSSRRPSRLMRESTTVLVPEDGSAASRVSTKEGTRHVDVPASAGGVLSPHTRRPPPPTVTTTKSLPSSMATTPLFAGGAPHLFIPASPEGLGGSALRQDTAYELVAMAKTVGPGDSVAAAEAQRRQLARLRDGESPLPSREVGSPHVPAGRRGSNTGGGRTAAAGRAASAAEASPATPDSPVSPPESSRVGKATAPKTKKKARKPAASAATTTTAVTAATNASASPAAKPTTMAVVEKGPTSTATAAIAAAGTDLAFLPIARPVGACDATEAQMRPLGTPTGVARMSVFPLPPNSSGVCAVGASGGTTATASPLHPAGGPHVTREEAEGLWYMTMLEVKAQRQELEDLRRACRSAEDHRQRRQDELHSLNRVFLPHTHPQELDCTLLYLKTVLYEPDDIPHGRLFLQQPDWLPVLAAVWTSPANRIRSVEVAAELTWVDIPRLGVMAGLLYHHNASSPLEELVLRSDKLLGAPRSGSDDATDALAKTKRKRLLKKKLADSMERSSTSLNFVTELDRTGTGFGPGCPPFFIAPEEARDTLWLLLCAVATNTAAANFRVVLRGIPTLESGGTGGSSSGSLDHEHHAHTASNAFSNFFSTRRRDDRNEEPLLLKPASMLLDSFVVQPTQHGFEDGVGHGRTGSGVGLFKGSSSTLPSKVPPSGAGAWLVQQPDVSRNNTFDEAGFSTTVAGSIHLESIGQPNTPANTPEQRHSPDASRQPSSLVIVTSTPVGTAASPDPLAADDHSGSFSPGRSMRRSLSTLLTLRPHSAATGAASGRSTPPPGKASTVMVPTHQHHVKRRPWACDRIEVEERPFYEVLTHRCQPIEEARAAAANVGDPSLLSSLFVAHYHHPFNTTHNDARFFVAPERQAQLQRAVQRAAAVANGEDFPEEVDESTAVYSSKAVLRGGRQLQLHPPNDDDDDHPPQQQQNHEPEAPQQQQVGGVTPSPPSPRPLVPCPPPLLFCETSVVFGLESAEEEARVLFYEEGQLRDRAADIWEALRKSVKHYNQAQQQARHKAMKGSAKGAAASPPPPARFITLEY